MLKKIALFEADNCERIVKAGILAQKNKFAQIVFIGNEKLIKEKFFKYNFKNIIFIDPMASNNLSDFAKQLYELRKEKGLTLKQANELIKNKIYFTTMLLKNNKIDGVVGGAITSTSDCLKPALQIIKAKEKQSLISSFFLLKSKDKNFGENGNMIVADCALNVNPNANELFEIAKSTFESVKAYIKTPKIAFLSYSTNNSANGEQVEKVKNAFEIFKREFPNVVCDGEIQADAALNEAVSLQKSPNSPLKGKANILIFPDLQSGNIAYKLMAYCKKIKAIGPICQGFAKPYNDVSRGAKVDEIVQMIKITAKQ